MGTGWATCRATRQARCRRPSPLAACNPSARRPTPATSASRCERVRCSLLLGTAESLDRHRAQKPCTLSVAACTPSARSRHQQHRPHGVQGFVSFHMLCTQNPSFSCCCTLLRFVQSNGRGRPQAEGDIVLTVSVQATSMETDVNGWRTLKSGSSPRHKATSSAHPILGCNCTALARTASTQPSKRPLDKLHRCLGR